MGAGYPAGFASVVYRFALPTSLREAEVVMGHIFPSSGVAQDHADDIRDAFVTNLQGSWPTTVTFLGVRCYIGPTPATTLVESNASVAGGSGGEVSYLAASVLVRKATATPGRKGKGRSYWPWVTETFVNPGGILTSAYVTGTQANFTAWFGDCAAAGVEPYILHGVDSMGAYDLPTPITSLTVEAKIATQRRRQRS